MAEKYTKKRNTGLAIACCFLFVLVLFIAFLVKKETIIDNLQTTNFFGRVFGKTPEFVEKHVATENKNQDKIELDKEVPLTINIQDIKSDKESKTENLSKKENKTEKAQELPSNKQPLKEETKKSEATKEAVKKQETTKPVEKPVALTELQLCFVEIDSNGSINRRIVKRSVPKNDSPLTNSINLLLKGPDTTRQSEKNCMSLIPNGTKLLSAKVSDGVAYLNFNDAFEINSVGVEGYIGQLMQVVYTATTFSTVNSVQFLIEGKKKEYLGSEGQWIGSPLSRNNF